MTELKTCYCAPTHHCIGGGSSCVSAIGCFYFAKLNELSTAILDERYGCFSNDAGHSVTMCRSHLPNHLILRCCIGQNSSFCNRHLRPNYTHTLSGVPVTSASDLIFATLLPLSFLIFGLLAIGVSYRCLTRMRAKKSAELNRLPSSISQFMTWRALSPLLLQPLQPASVSMAQEEDDNAGCTSGSGSGSGVPFLVRRTIARQTTLTACVGKGRFGEVWRASCQDEIIAVKIFSSRDEASWARETEIYNTGLLRHPNLLAYYASDMISRGGCTQLWLITAYHPNGSLHDCLLENTLPVHAGLRLARSIAAGLAFLHSELAGLHVKPAIAHRDIKSKNILILRNGEGCLADLGLGLLRSSAPEGAPTLQPNAACFFGNTGGPSSAGPPPAGPLVGTKRYMAPELLSLYPQIVGGTGLDSSHADESCDFVEQIGNRVAHLSFETYQAADIYALALVFWEIARRTEGASPETRQPDEYQVPYWYLVPTNPTFAQMYRVVVLGVPFDATDFSNPTSCNPSEAATSKIGEASEGMRPELSARWLNSDSGLARFAALIEECWRPVWSARLSALRIRKTLEALESMAACINEPLQLPTAMTSTVVPSPISFCSL